MVQWVYQFGGGVADGTADQKSLLGGKGAGLAEMTALGMPVPPGFTITTDVCRKYMEDEGVLPESLAGQVEAALEKMAETCGRRLGDTQRPLLVSVRSGAAISMPGMMDTILNLGLNDTTVECLVAETGDARFAFDCYRRFVAMYSQIVLQVKDQTTGRGQAIASGHSEQSPFATILHKAMADQGVSLESELSVDSLRGLVTEYKIEVLRRTDKPFPEDPMTQLWGAIGAVLRSWNNDRARAYRRIHGIPHELGTAVSVQAMVFGNKGENSATGVAFSRNPSTGASGLFGEYLPNAQGEDVVAGTHTPIGLQQLQQTMPDVYSELDSIASRLERHFCDMQDLEFTLEDGRLWLLQTRNGKRSGKAMVRIALDLVKEGVIDKKQAVLRLDPSKVDELLHPKIDPEFEGAVVAYGAAASPGAAAGAIVLTSEEAVSYQSRGENSILVRVETSPEDIEGMKAADGILTTRGGITSHAAVVARGMGTPCITACQSVTIDAKQKQVTVGDTVCKVGDIITIDGSSGGVYLGNAPLVPGGITEDFTMLMEWVDEHRRLRVRANADTPQDARVARKMGAEGIGLCRTEHMFFTPERVVEMRKMILAQTEEARAAALDAMLPMQQEDFEGIFRAMDGFPVTIRLLDPPLHEFLPRQDQDKEIKQLARSMGQKVTWLKQRIASLREQNPMLGHRGCRLAITYPPIYAMQTKAIARALAVVVAEGCQVYPEIMVPFVMDAQELRVIAKDIRQQLAMADTQTDVLVGTMIELPRSCLLADKIAEHADFFSFGTNDLTQTVFGLSRDDSGHFLPEYVHRNLLSSDPFVSLDRAGVGWLLQRAVELGRSKKTKLKIGICGEHGGDASSVEFCHAEGFDYVSCSTFRIPKARIAAAHAALRREARK